MCWKGGPRFINGFFIVGLAIEFLMDKPTKPVMSGLRCSGLVLSFAACVRMKSLMMESMLDLR